MRNEYVTTVCDVEDLDGREVLGQTVTMTIDGQTVEVDLCPVDDERLLGPLRALIEARGRVVEGQAARRACQHPECILRFTRTSARAAHYRNDHPDWTPPADADEDPEPVAHEYDPLDTPVTPRASARAKRRATA